MSVDRRTFLKVTALTGGGFMLSGVLRAAAEEEDDTYALNAFVSIASDGRVTIQASIPDMGQGVKTALPMIIAEELGVAWEDVEVVQAPADESRFGRQATGGSYVIALTFDLMRQTGASAREMLISAGALVMEVPREELRAANSRVEHTRSGQFRTFGELASLAAKQTPPEAESLVYRGRQDYTVIGTAVGSVDNGVIVRGDPIYGIDKRLPGLLYAAYWKCPTIGGKVVSANVEEIKRLPGIKDAFLVRGNGNVRELLDGVAIVGTDTWSVFHTAERLKVEWDTTGASQDSWTEMVAAAKALHGKRGDKVTLEKGSVNNVFDDPANTVHQAFYEYPFVTHLCLEPMNCTAHFQSGPDGDSLEMWVPTQFVARPIEVAKTVFKLSDQQIKMNYTRMGGSFGRRSSNEYVCEAIAISKRMKAPVKLTWSREDDMIHDFFRTGGFQSVKAAVNSDGRLVGIEHHFIGTQNDGKPVAGAWFQETEFPLQNVDNVLATQTFFEIGTPCGPWRAPGSNTSAFVMQSFLAEMAHLGERDYVEFLLEILGEPRWFEEGNIRSMNTGRAADVIRKAAAESGWGKPLPEGRALGLAFYFCHAAHIAEVAEVSVSADRELTIHKVTAAVDVGPIINQSGALSQVEGSIIDGISTMMTQKITMEAGQIQQTNFDEYEVLRIHQAPPVDVHFIESDYAPTGLGEPGLPPVAPAVANAIFNATGHRIRKMPFSEEGYRLVRA